MRKNFIGWTAATIGTAAAIAFAAGVVGSTAAASEADRSSETRGFETPGGPGLTMEAILGKLRERGYEDVREIEREDDRYEMKAVGRDGRKVELYVDPNTGEILRQKTDD